MELITKAVVPGALLCDLIPISKTTRSEGFAVC